MSTSLENALVCIPPRWKARVWPLVADRLRAAFLRTDLGHTEDLEKLVLHGPGDLWLAMSGADIEAAMVTRLARTDRNLICEIVALGGANMDRWLDHLPAIEAWARREGAAKLRLIGRVGWAALLHDHYKVSNVVLERVF